LHALHHADTVAQGAGTKLQGDLGDDFSRRGDAMLRRVVQQFFHEYGNGRALENTRREVHKARFENERIEAVVKRLSEPFPEAARAQDGRGAA
jgi:hypothetical protein